jgi:hypothetical protein
LRACGSSRRLRLTVVGADGSPREPRREIGRQVRGAVVMRAAGSGTSVADARVYTDDEWRVRNEGAQLPVQVPRSSGRRVWD